MQLITEFQLRERRHLRVNQLITQTTDKPSHSKPVTLINFIEVWRYQPLPNEVVDDGQAGSLRLEKAIRIDDGVPSQIERSTTEIAKGEQIAGSAWQQESPVILQGLSSAEIQIAAQEADVPITAMLAIPIYREFILVDVIVLGLAQGNGGIELWTRDDRDELGISGSCYRGLESFEFISRFVKFPKGAGLPGYSWKFGQPRIIDRPQTNPDFIRSFDRDPAHIERCIGLPIGREYGFPASVLLMLSDQSTPFANEMDVWHCASESPTEEHPSPKIRFQNSHSEVGSEEKQKWCQTICDQIAETRSTVLISQGNELPPQFELGIAMPIFDGQKIKDVFIMLL